MPGSEKESRNGEKKFLPGDDGTRKSWKKPKLKAKFQPSKAAVTSPKLKADCKNKSKKNNIAWRNITINTFLKKTKSLKKSSLSCQQSRLTRFEDSEQDQSADVKIKNIRKKKRRKKRKGNVEPDEASRLQRRTRYLLIKMKLEQNLIDAYSAEGWKGQSREKIRPEMELQRARKQILKCKLGIRDAIHQLDLLSSAGRIDDSAVAPDGSVHHEHIICAKCKLREAFPDNDIILCDGTCNRAFHQRCLDPPLSTENIPPGDEGWFCKFCKSKMEILEATNAHLGTNFALDSNWQDIFKEEAVSPDGADSMICPEHEWPSEDSDDDDYDPDKIDDSSSGGIASSGSDDSSSFCSLGSLEEEVLFLTGQLRKNSEAFQGGDPELIMGDFDETAGCEVLCGRRQRPSVDYIKLNDELFGKNHPPEEWISEDEDWGPELKRRRKEFDAPSTIMSHSDAEKNIADEESAEGTKDETGKTKRSLFRIPRQAVEQLRIVFAENELPPRSVREDLAQQLGLEFEKVNKWFKNARYLALKARKADGGESCQAINSGTSEEAHPELVNNDSSNLTSETKRQTPNRLKSFDGNINISSPTNPLETNQQKGEVVRSLAKKTSPSKMKQLKGAMLQSAAEKKNQPVVDSDDDVSLKFLREKAKKEKKKSKKKARKRTLETEAEADMKKLCLLKDRIEKLQQVLLRLPNKSSVCEPAVMFVPVAELKVKR